MHTHLNAILAQETLYSAAYAATGSKDAALVASVLQGILLTVRGLKAAGARGLDIADAFDAPEGSTAYMSPALVQHFNR